MSELRRQLKSGNVWSAKHDMSPIEGVERAAADADEETRQAWGAEAVALLGDRDTVLRTRAVAALDVLPFEAASVVDALSRHGALLDVEAEGYPLHPTRLDQALYKRLARDSHPDARPVLRARLAHQPMLAVLLARSDSRWLVANAQLVRRRVLGGVLRGLPQDLRPRLLQNMGPWDDAIDILQMSWWKGLPDADALRDIVAAG